MNFNKIPEGLTYGWLVARYIVSVGQRRALRRTLGPPRAVAAWDAAAAQGAAPQRHHLYALANFRN